MLEELEHGDYAANLNTTFHLQHPQLGPLDLELVEVSELKETRRQRIFSIVFRGPLEPDFDQGLFPVEHERLGAGSLFLVPIAREADGMRYEAVFNRLVKS